MKHLLIATAAAAVFVSGSAMAQEATLAIEPAHETVIKQYVVKEHLRPVRVKETLAVGTVVPEDVTIAPVPDTLVSEVPEVKSYDYFDYDGKIVFVDHTTRKVVKIVD